MTSSARVQADCPVGRATVLGCEIDRVDFEQALSVCEEAIRSRSLAQHMAINVAKLVAMRSDADLREIVADCDLVTADGQPVVWASRLLGDPLPMRVAGIDLMDALLARSAQKGYRVYVLGAKAEVLECAVKRIRRKYNGVSIVGYRDGYYAQDEESEVAASVAAAAPDILFVAMSSPYKEYFLGKYRREMGVPFVMGVGGAIDVVAGVTKRAPALMQRTGLEWLFRLLQEPRRLFPRYFSTNTRFVMLILREFAHHKFVPTGPGTLREQ